MSKLDAALAASIVVMAAALMWQGLDRRVNMHMDAEHDIICYTYKSTMECFPYYDEGTHLEFIEV